MALKRMVLEIGMGNDLHGGDYTKAAVRAVQARREARARRTGNLDRFLGRAHRALLCACGFVVWGRS